MQEQKVIAQERVRLVSDLMSVYILEKTPKTDDEFGDIFDKLYEKPIDELRALWRITNSNRR